MQARAEDLRVGDTIEVWWKPGQDTITSIKPYVGNLSGIMCGVATFALSEIGMSLESGSFHEVMGRAVFKNKAA